MPSSRATRRTHLTVAPRCPSSWRRSQRTAQPRACPTTSCVRSANAPSTCSASAWPPTGCRPAPQPSDTCSTRAGTRRRPWSARGRWSALPRQRSPMACWRTPSTTTTPTCRRYCTPAPAWFPQLWPRPSMPARRASSPSVRSPSASKSRCGWAWPATTPTSATRSSSSTGSTPRRSPARWALPSPLPWPTASTSRASPMPWASPRPWPPASSRPTAPAAPSSGCTAAWLRRRVSPPPSWCGAASRVRRRCSRAASGSSRPGSTASSSPLP